MPRINGERLLGDLRRIAEFGRYKTGGHRPLYRRKMSLAPMARERFDAAGLEPVIDGIGNVMAATQARQKARSARLAQRDAAAWRLARRRARRDLRPRSSARLCRRSRGARRGRDRGRSPGLMRRGITATCSAAARSPGASARRDRRAKSRDDGSRLPDRAGRGGRLAAAAARERLDLGALSRLFRSAYRAGRYAGRRAAAHRGRRERSSAAGNYWVTVTGEQNHAGTTPMSRSQGRRRGAWCDSAVAIDGSLRPNSPGRATVWTIGRMLLDPNAPRHRARPRRDAGAIPRYRYRHPGAVRSRGSRSSRRTGARAVRCRERAESRKGAVGDGFAAARRDRGAAERHAPGQHLRMPSGAGHDAQILSRRLRSAMLLCPASTASAHHWTEDTEEDDIVLGAQVFADAAAKILKGN